MPHPKGREFEYEEARDRTGEAFQMVPHQRQSREIRDDLKLLREPNRFHCQACRRPDRFRILYDAAPGDNNVVMIGCECGVWSRALELRVPQMDDSRARSLGLILPDNYRVPQAPVFEMEIDLDED